MKRQLQYLGMALGGGLAGVLSGLLWLIPNGLMGGALGASLALGAIWLGSRQRAQGGSVTGRQVTLAGLLSGLLGGSLMAAIALANAGVERNMDGFGPPRLPFWAPLVMGVLYGLVMQWGYATRLRASHRFGSALFWTCGGCFLLKTLAGMAYIVVLGSSTNPEMILTGPLALAVFGALPFAFLWILAMRIFDPEW